MNDIKLKNLFNKLDSIDERLKKIEGYFFESSMPIVHQESQSNKTPLKHMAEKTNLELNILCKIYDLEDEDVKLNVSLDNRKESEKQVIASLLILTCKYYCYGTDLIRAMDLNKKLKWLGIKSLSNLKSNLSKDGYFETKGKSRSNNYSYKITFPGLKKAIEYIKIIVKENKNEQ